MNRRLELHDLFIGILGTEEEEFSRVYFQPPQDVQLMFPCIIYRRNTNDTRYASDKLYKTRKSYSVTVVDSDPDGLIPDKVALLPYSRFERHYTADNLNHDVFNVYY